MRFSGPSGDHKLSASLASSQRESVALLITPQPERA
jgi:hypothetical protein